MYLDPHNKLNPNNESFVGDLYRAASRHVLSVRTFCQFKDERRVAIALTALKNIRACVQQQQPLVSLNKDQQFLMDFVQSAAFKKIQHYFFNNMFGYVDYAISAVSSSLQDDSQNLLRDFFQAFLVNKEGWYARFCAAVPDRRELFHKLLDTVIELAHEYPQALHSQQVLAALEQEAELEDSLSVSSPKP
jgi:hypothetical protein